MDAIGIENSQNIWIDHCELKSGQKQNISQQSSQKPGTCISLYIFFRIDKVQ